MVNGFEIMVSPKNLILHYLLYVVVFLFVFLFVETISKINIICLSLHCISLYELTTFGMFVSIILFLELKNITNI